MVFLPKVNSSYHEKEKEETDDSADVPESPAKNKGKWMESVQKN